eukprot:6585412-Pyramimonas_sp.AAC.1
MKATPTKAAPTKAPPMQTCIPQRSPAMLLAISARSIGAPRIPLSRARDGRALVPWTLVAEPATVSRGD